MTDIAIVVLSGKEELHIKRCLEKLAPLEPRQVFIVESQRGDKTHEVAVETAKALNWSVEDATIERRDFQSVVGTTLYLVWRAWPGLYAPQMNWAFDNLPIATEWVMRLDADEYYLPEAIEEMKVRLSQLPSDITGIIHKRRTYIFGGWAKHGTYPVKMIRVFRRGKAVCEERYMDEHMQLTEGRSVEFKYDLVDENLNPFSWWREKHLGYAKREAQDCLNRFARYSWNAEVDFDGNPLTAMDRLKTKYYHTPRFLRAVAYWFKRYVIGGGFLDGACGWRWNLWQGLWYRWQVDLEIGRQLKNAKVTY